MSSLVDVRLCMTRYGMSTLLGLGIVGNIINIFMFTRKDSLRNSCSLYILAACILNLFNLCWGIIPSLYVLDNVDPGTYLYIYCKLNHYLIHAPLMMSRSLTVLACMDRYALCSSSIQIRSLAEPKIAVRVIIGVIVLWPIITVFLPISYVFRSGPGGCSLSPSVSTGWTIYSVIVPGILTPTLMIVFGGLAVLNRQELQKRLMRKRGTTKKREYTLILMLFSEVIVYVGSTCLFPAVSLYQLLTNGSVRSIEKQQILSFLQYLGNKFLIYVYPTAGFYVYVMVSRSYRMEFKRTCIHLYRRITRRSTAVMPMTTNRENTMFNGTTT